MQSNTVPVENQPVNLANFSVENRKADPFTIADGQYVGHDGFVVPRNFDEFHERFPQYVRNWVNRHVDRSAPKEDVEDWTQDLLIHLRYLPATSKHREAGKEDVVQTFDPCKHHGANSARFFNYINLCLGNKFRTIYSKRMKNPLCRPGNLSLTTHLEETDRHQVGDEFCHAHSAHLRERCERQEKQRDARHALTEFVDFCGEGIRVFSLSWGRLRRPRRLPLLSSCWGRRKRTSAACARGCASWAGASSAVIRCRGSEDRIGDE